MTVPVFDPETCRLTRGGYGYYTYSVDHYTTFVSQIAPLFVHSKLPAGSHLEARQQQFLWRGMADPSWALQSSLSRFASKEIKKTRVGWLSEVSRMTTRHLIEFMRQVRGLKLLDRSHDDLFRYLLGEQSAVDFLTVYEGMDPAEKNLTLELFALGQHFRLNTPFLDWTLIPLISLYFAFQEQGSRPDGVGQRVVFALNRTQVESIQRKPPVDSTLLVLESMAHDNSRVMAQSGVFTFSPEHKPVDQWVVSKCKDPRFAPPSETPVLIRFLIQNVDRKQCLDDLAALNIHARTVFPDLFGASDHANFQLESFKLGMAIGNS